MADHAAFLLRAGGVDRLAGVSLFPAGRLPACHQDDDVPDVCYVGDHLERVVHHSLLMERKQSMKHWKGSTD